MLFGATRACPSCALRFTRRDACPSCGGAVVSLEDREERAKLRRGVRGARAWGRTMFALARWAPKLPWITIAVGVLMAVPAVESVLIHPNKLLNLWLVDDPSSAEARLYIEYEGLSGGGFKILALGAAGLVLASLSTLAWLARRATQPAPARTLRVCRGGDAGDGDAPRDEVTGTARLATTELQSPLGGEPCLAFGLRGEVDGAEISDADGGDFDLVLPDGSVVMVSLEHARLEPSGAEERLVLTPEEAADLDEFFLPRIAQRVHATCALAETIVAEGDTVSVVGDLRGKGLAVAPFRHVARSHVIGGEADRPLVVRVVARGSRLRI